MKCKYEGCKVKATAYAFRRNVRLDKKDLGRFGINKYCSYHAAVVIEEGTPEYEVECPKCGCMFGVN